MIEFSFFYKWEYRIECVTDRIYRNWKRIAHNMSVWIPKYLDGKELDEREVEGLTTDYIEEVRNGQRELWEQDEWLFEV